MKTRVLVTVGFFALLAAMVGYAQHQTPEIKARVDFPFTVEGKVLPAGEYDFIQDSQAKVFNIQGEGKTHAIAMILTRLYGGMHTTPEDAHLVFDVVGGVSYLSEIWIPGEDGYVLLATKGKHEHKVINVKY